MGCACVLEFCRVQEPAPRSMDWMERASARGAAQAYRQQRTFFDPARCPHQKSCIKGVELKYQAAFERLGACARHSIGVGRDVCRSLTISRDMLCSSRMDSNRADSRFWKKSRDVCISRKIFRPCSSSHFVITPQRCSHLRLRIRGLSPKRRIR